MDRLTARLAAQAAADPARPLFTFLDRGGAVLASYTYGEFHRRTNGLARALAEKAGVAVGEPVLLVYPPGLEMIAAFMACAKAGALPVPVPPPGGPGDAAERLRGVAMSAGAA